MPSNGLVAEVVRSGMSSQERVDRYTNVRSVSIPSTQAMVRLDDVVDILEVNDDVPPHAIYDLRETIEEDPSTGGHIAIESPSSSSHTADFDRLDIYAPLEHDARGSFVVGSENTWLKTTISRDLDGRLDEAARNPTIDGLRDDIVPAALEEYLDDSDPLEDVDDDALVAELHSRGWDALSDLPYCHECGDTLGSHWRRSNERAQANECQPAPCPTCGENPLPPVGGGSDAE